MIFVPLLGIAIPGKLRRNILICRGIFYKIRQITLIEYESKIYIKEKLTFHKE